MCSKKGKKQEKKSISNLTFYIELLMMFVYVKGYEKEEYAIPLIREEVPRLKGHLKEGLQKVAFEPEF